MPIKYKSGLRDNPTMDLLKKHLHRIGIEIENEAKLSMEGGGKPHTPSRPGEPPHVDTGRLRASITTEIESDAKQVTVRVGTNVGYGLYLELGTNQMLPRPWLRPAFLKVISKYQ